MQFSLLNDEQMSNKVGVEHQPDNQIFFHKKTLGLGLEDGGPLLCYFCRDQDAASYKAGFHNGGGPWVVFWDATKKGPVMVMSCFLDAPIYNIMYGIYLHGIQWIFLNGLNR